MRHIYNGGSSDTGGSFDKDEAWSEVMEAGAEASVAEGVAERGGQRWVKTDPLTLLPDTMCVDLSLTFLLASSLPCFHCSPFPQLHPHVFQIFCNISIFFSVMSSCFCRMNARKIL